MRRSTDASRPSILSFASCSVSGLQLERGSNETQATVEPRTGHCPPGAHARTNRRTMQESCDRKISYVCVRGGFLGHVARRPGAEQQGIRARGIQLKTDNREEHEQRGATDANAPAHRHPLAKRQ